MDTSMSKGRNPKATYDLTDTTVAILATNGFEQSELESPREALLASGATVHVVGLPAAKRTIRGWQDGDWGTDVEIDRTVDEVRAEDYDGLVLPGGVMNPDALRMNEKAVAFTRAFFEQGKPVAAICHGPWTLIEADVVDGRTMTSWPSIRTDLENAGVDWVDEEVVVDDGLVTSRKPADLPAFNAKVCEEMYEGIHAGQTV